MSSDPMLYQYRTLGQQQHHQQVALAYLGKLLAYTKGGFRYVPSESAPVVAPEQYLDTVSNISTLLLDSGSMQNIAKDIYAFFKPLEHSKLEYILSSSSDKYFMTPPVDTPNDMFLFTVTLCPPLSYLWHVYVKLKCVTSHIGFPVYPPKFIKLYLSCTPLLKNGYVYESDPFPISNTDELQCLSLPSHIPGALFAHVVLCGARQQSPEDGKYYVAIEHMAFQGVIAGSLATIAMKTLEMSRVGIHLSRTSTVMVHDVMQRHVLNTCNTLSRINVNCYKAFSTWASRKMDSQSKEAGGMSHLQVLSALQSKSSAEVTASTNVSASANTHLSAENSFSTIPWDHRNMILNVMTNEISRDDCEGHMYTCTSRYCANSLKWIENTLMYIAVEANQFKSRRLKDKMLLQSGQPYFIPKVEYNTVFARRWNLDSRYSTSL